MRGIVRLAALAAFAFYLAWNAVWLAHGQVPPSIFRAFTGLPCPTTGGLRSLQAISRGHVAESLLFNPLMPAYVLLFCYSAAVLLRQMVRREKLALRPVVAWMWWVSLLVGWVAKFALGRQYW